MAEYSDHLLPHRYLLPRDHAPPPFTDGVCAVSSHLRHRLHEALRFGDRVVAKAFVKIFVKKVLQIFKTRWINQDQFMTAILHFLGLGWGPPYQ